MSALDKSGELNRQIVQKELVDALVEDRTYRITDDAKKKHIATAASYDEFRHFVACADQKRVTRSEMESLGKPEKGWQTKTKLATGNPSGKRERGCGGQTRGKGRMAEAFPVEPPKSPMAFERDWRRHCSGSEARQLKLRFLRLCGPKTLRRIFKVEIDVAILGQILCTLAETAELHAGGIIEGNEELWFSVLDTLTKTGRFDLNKQFLGEKEKGHVRQVLAWLHNFTESSSVDEKPNFTGEDIARCKAKYLCP